MNIIADLLITGETVIDNKSKRILKNEKGLTEFGVFYLNYVKEERDNAIADARRFYNSYRETPVNMLDYFSYEEFINNYITRIIKYVKAEDHLHNLQDIYNIEYRSKYYLVKTIINDEDIVNRDSFPDSYKLYLNALRNRYEIIGYR